MLLLAVVELACWPIARLLQRKLPILALSVAMLGLGSNLLVSCFVAFYSLQSAARSLGGSLLALMMVGLACLLWILCGGVVIQIIRAGYLIKIPSVESAI